VLASGEADADPAAKVTRATLKRMFFMNAIVKTVKGEI